MGIAISYKASSARLGFLFCIDAVYLS